MPISFYETQDSDSVLLYTPTVTPDTDWEDQFIEFECFAGNDGDEVRGIVKYIDDNNYLFAQVTFDEDCGELSLHRRLNGTNYELATTPLKGSEPSKWGYMAVCWHDNTFKVRWRGRGSDMGYMRWGRRALVTQTLSYAISVTGTQVALGTGDIDGASPTSMARFRNFVAARHYDETDRPDCPDCEFKDCFIHEDDFWRADSASADDLGCFWNLDAGTAQIASQVLEVTAQDTEVKCTLPQPNGVGEMVVQGRIRVKEVGDIGAVWVAYASSGQLAKMEIERTSDTECEISLHSAAGLIEGPTTVTASKGSGDGDWHNFCLMAEGEDGTDYRITGVLNDTAIEDTTGSIGSVFYMKLGSGGTVGASGAIHFDNITYSRTREGYQDRRICPTCTPEVDCTACSETTGNPRYLKVVPHGMTSGASSLCANCEDWNGIEFTIPFVGYQPTSQGCGGSFSGNCRYTATAESSLIDCTTNESDGEVSIHACIQWTGSPKATRLRIQLCKELLGGFGGVSCTTFQKNYTAGSPPDCTQFDKEVIPWSANDPSLPACEGNSNSYCEVTMIS